MSLARFTRLVGGATRALPLALLGCGSVPELAVPSAAPEWSTQLGGEGFQAPLAVASAGELRIWGGAYTEQLSIGDHSATGAGGLEGVVAAVDEEGETRWVRELSGPLDELVTSLVVGEGGALYAAGQVGDGTSFGGMTLST